MARPRKTLLPTVNVPPNLTAWAESLGEALGRGVARGINAGLANLSLGPAVSTSNVVSTGRRGRPPRLPLAPAPAERRCKMEGCIREARSKGLCSAHYQAERRRAAKA